jgi:addiction module HigA family antidote
MQMHNPPHPGEILKELYIQPLDLTILEVAKGIGVSRKSLSELVNKKYGISPDMAIRLGKAFSTTPESWLNLQTQYNLWKARKHRIPKIKIFIHSHASQN